ncbi:MAG: hypothetical protein WCT18_00685 [Patescibacteria group bacterium]
MNRSRGQILLPILAISVSIMLIFMSVVFFLTFRNWRDCQKKVFLLEEANRSFSEENSRLEQLLDEKETGSFNHIGSTVISVNSQKENKVTEIFPDGMDEKDFCEENHRRATRGRIYQVKNEKCFCREEKGSIGQSVTFCSYSSTYMEE